jgi:hypothetical protein
MHVGFPLYWLVEFVFADDRPVQGCGRHDGIDYELC